MYFNCLSLKNLISTSPSQQDETMAFFFLDASQRKIQRNIEIITYCLLICLLQARLSLTSVCLLPHVMFKFLSRILSGIVPQPLTYIILHSNKSCRSMPSFLQLFNRIFEALKSSKI